jgi:hypothetical protein
MPGCGSTALTECSRDLLSREPLIKYSMSLLDLKRAYARRNPQLMALVLSKGCNTAEVRFRSSPQGPSEQPYVGVGSLCNVSTLLQEAALIYDRSEGQRYRILGQRSPRSSPRHQRMKFSLAYCKMDALILNGEQCQLFWSNRL